MGRWRHHRSPPAPAPAGAEATAGAPALQQHQDGLAAALTKLGFPPGIIAQVVDELVVHLSDSQARALIAPGQWCIERTNQLVNELATPGPPAEPADPPQPEEDLCPTASRGWTAPLAWQPARH